MSDDARIERLTQLARRMWPDRPYVEARSGLGFAEVRDGPRDGGWIHSLLRVDHGNALDALEAALLILAREPPAWVEQLALCWEHEAGTYRKVRTPGGWSWYDELANKLERCAFELRERAKESSA